MSEEIITGPLKGAKTPEELEVQRYKPPSKHRIKFKRHVFQVERWIQSNGLVTRDQVIAYSMRAFNIEKKQANEIYKAVEEDFQRIGKVYGK